MPERGVVRLNGQNITYVSPEMRAKYLASCSSPVATACSANLTVEQNLAVSARLNADEPQPRCSQRIAGVFDLFPELDDHRKQVASSLSGGQQQMLALGACPDPRARAADDRRALARASRRSWCSACSKWSRSSRRRGQTMIIVEQSLNVAIAVADRAIFLEKGEVRFEGPTAGLLERGDLARAVFFGTEGG